jgi:predicted CopG family antitoxin
MGTKTIRLDEDVYERLREQKRDDETFSEAVQRLLGGPSLAELGDVIEDEDRLQRMRDVIEAADEADAEEVDEVLERFR